VVFQWTKKDEATPPEDFYRGAIAFYDELTRLFAVKTTRLAANRQVYSETDSPCLYLSRMFCNDDTLKAL